MPTEAIGKTRTWIDRIWSHPSNRGRRGRQLLHGAGFQLRGRLLHRATVTPIGQRSRMWARLGSDASALVVYANPPDHEEWQVWRRLLRPGDLFIDVGANVGTYTLLAAEVGATVIAVEPDATNAAQLRANLALNGYDAEILPKALSDRPGTAHFTSDRDCTNHLVLRVVGASKTYEVPTDTLDRVIDRREVAGVKIDVEGAERLVLEGARDALSAGRIRLLQLEWNDQSVSTLGEGREPVAAFLAAYGYGLYVPTPDGHLVQARDPRRLDVFAAREESIGELLA